MRQLTRSQAKRCLKHLQVEQVLVFSDSITTQVKLCKGRSSCLTRATRSMHGKATDPFIVAHRASPTLPGIRKGVFVRAEVEQNVDASAIAGFKRCARLKVETTAQVHVNLHHPRGQSPVF